MNQENKTLPTLPRLKSEEKGIDEDKITKYLEVEDTLIWEKKDLNASING